MASSNTSTDGNKATLTIRVAREHPRAPPSYQRSIHAIKMQLALITDSPAAAVPDLPLKAIDNYVFKMLETGTETETGPKSKDDEIADLKEKLADAKEALWEKDYELNSQNECVMEQEW